MRRCIHCLNDVFVCVGTVAVAVGSRLNEHFPGNGFSVPTAAGAFGWAFNKCADLKNHNAKCRRVNATRFTTSQVGALETRRAAN